MTVGARRLFASAALIGVLLVPTAASARRVPRSFVGMNVGGPLLTPRDHVDLDRQLGAMRRSGVGTVRVAFSWAAAQPYPSEAALPPGARAHFVDVAGLPTDFSTTDRVVDLAAKHGLRVLPVVLYAPAWDASPNPDGGFATPAQPGPYGAFLRALVHRYGPQGSFWGRARPALPIRAWQIWNEPNLGFYWPQPSAAGYAALLRVAAVAVKRADPHARVVLGALTNFSWSYLAELYGLGARPWFDVVAVNQFAATPARILTILGLVRQTLIRFGDRGKPLLATELSWTSARSSCECAVYDWDTTAEGQARQVAAAVPLLAAARHRLGLAGFDFYTWMGDESRLGYDFNFAGLLALRRGKIVVKPALAAFARAARAIER